MNLFLLSAPYQLLSALECIHHFGFTDNRLVVVDTGHFESASFDAVIDPKAWGPVDRLDVRGVFTDLDFGTLERPTLRDHAVERWMALRQIRTRARVERFVRGSARCEALILGNYLADYDLHMRHLANHLTYEQLYLVDVGTDTLRIARQRNEENRIRATSAEVSAPPVASPVKRLRSGMRRRWVDYDGAGVDRLTFFSAYDLEVSGEDTLVRNTYAYTRSRLGGNRSTDSVYFVGQPLVDQSYVREATFSRILVELSRYFEGRRIVYIRHPRESDAQLDIVRRHGFEVGQGRAPFEHEVCFGPDQPGCVAAFFSSVVGNCAAIFGASLPLLAFRIPPEVLLKDHHNVAQIYEQFSAHETGAIEVIDLKLRDAAR